MQKLPPPKYYLITLALLVLIICWLTTLDHITVAYINNTPISLREFKQALSTQTSHVIGYFDNKYGAAYSSTFWDTPYGNESPIDTLHSNTLNYLTQIKIEQQLAVDFNLAPSTHYADFLKQLDQENLRRQQALKNNEILYGPPQYKEQDYFKYIHTNLVLSLKQYLANTLFELTEATLQQLYNQRVAEGNYQLDNTYQTLVLQIDKDFFGIDPPSRKKALEMLEHIHTQLTSAKEFDFFYDSIDASHPVHAYPLSFNDETLFFDLEEQPELREAALTLIPGEISNVIETYNKYSVLKCEAIVENGLADFKSLKPSLYTELLDVLYNDYIHTLVNSASIRTRPWLIRRIYPE